MKGKPVDIRGKKYHPVVGRIMMIHEACAQPQPKAVEISVEKTEETDHYIDVKATVTTHVQLNGSKELTKLEYTDMAREYFEEKKGKFSPVNFAHALENASTSAIGRALRNAGFPGDDELIDEETGRSRKYSNQCQPRKLLVLTGRIKLKLPKQKYQPTKTTKQT